jgi:uncharacterized Zn-finger protein
MRNAAAYDQRNAEKPPKTQSSNASKKALTMSDVIPETVQVEHSTFSCDGGGGGLGHPKVQLTLDKSGQVDCGYCGLHFELKPGASAESGH